MIILHKGNRVDNNEEIKGYLTKMWGQFHITMENDENVAYPVLEDTISPCFEENPLQNVKLLNLDLKNTKESSRWIPPSGSVIERVKMLKKKEVNFTITDEEAKELAYILTQYSTVKNTPIT